jgi:hypothetical protein
MLLVVNTRAMMALAVAETVRAVLYIQEDIQWTNGGAQSAALLLCVACADEQMSR